MRLVALLLAVLASPAALARVLEPAGTAASSTEAPDQGVSYDVKNIVDGKAGTVWVEGEEGSGLGSWVRIDLKGQQTVDAIRIWNGNWYTWDFWKRHNRAKEIEVEFSDGSKEHFTLADEFKPEVIKLSKPVKTTFVKLKIKSVYNGTTFNDTCLSEVQVLNSEPDENIPVVRYNASSIYPADNDGTYEPANVADGLLDSMWCENDKDGDGTGEWLEFDFGRPTEVSRLVLRNGNAYSFKMFMKGNRAKAATLTFSDGSTEQVAIKPSMVEQVVSFPPHTTRTVRVTFTEVSRGTEYNDLCISEAYFRK